ncbi:MAG TPA: hypothetical protein VHY19_04825 [Steroidobacteraceae bacterium]|nr:hypothetical protein [Steroidobacteraceae bacterium]
MASKQLRFLSANFASRAATAGAMTCATAVILAAAASPVRAQVGIAASPVDLSGSWSSPLTQDALERVPGPVPGDWTGMPLTAGEKVLAQSYDGAMLAEPEKVCQFYNQWHYMDGAFSLRIWPIVTGPTDGIRGWRIESIEDIGGMQIWLDGRPEPSKYARHQLGAFSTGHWVGNMLVAKTIDMKPSEMRRNGAFMSDEATLTNTYMLQGDNMMTVVGVLQDPIYLTQPYIYVRSYDKSTRPVPSNWGPCIINDEGTAEGAVPFYLPGKNPITSQVYSQGKHPIVGQMMHYYHIPAVASNGGADTMYPEFRDKIKDQFLEIYPSFPKECTDAQYCAFGAQPPRGAQRPAPTPRAPRPQAKSTAG